LSIEAAAGPVEVVGLHPFMELVVEDNGVVDDHAESLRDRDYFDVP
jgi:hypothetical protein